MILQNKEQFIKYIPTAAASDWRDMETFRDSAERWLKNEILGRVLYEELEAVYIRHQYQRFQQKIADRLFDGLFHGKQFPFIGTRLGTFVFTRCCPI